MSKIIHAQIDDTTHKEIEQIAHDKMWSISFTIKYLLNKQLGVKK